MPLFGRRLFQINENDVKTNEECHTIEHTGEQFANRDLYERIERVYQLERWTCECTWKSGLTHKDAYQSENEIRKTLTTLVPEYFNKTIFEIVQHSE